MNNTNELTHLTSLNSPIWGTFQFPRLPNGKGVETPFIRSDAPDAELLIQEWFIQTSKVVPFRFYAFPEVFEKDGTTQTPLHYHCLFYDITNPAKFMRVAQRKFDLLLRNRFPNARHRRQPLWLEWIDRNDVEKLDSPETYCLKQYYLDWNTTHLITDDMVKPTLKSAA